MENAFEFDAKGTVAGVRGKALAFFKDRDPVDQKLFDLLETVLAGFMNSTAVRVFISSGVFADPDDKERSFANYQAMASGVVPCGPAGREICFEVEPIWGFAA